MVTLDPEAIDRFITAAEYGDDEFLATLLVGCPTLLSAKDENGWTALHRASRAGETDVVRYLLASGANPNVRDRKGNTPLHDAAEGPPSSVSALALLLAAGANIEAKNRSGRTALIGAAHYSNLPQVAYLLAKGADAGVRDRRGWSALVWMEYSYESAVKNRRKFKLQIFELDVMRELLGTAPSPDTVLIPTFRQRSRG